MDNLEQFKNKFETILKENFKSKTACAKALGVSHTAISSTINGTSIPSVSLIAKFAKITGVSLDWLLLDDSNNEEQENFKLHFAENLRKNINSKFKSQNDFADSFNEKHNIVNMWCIGEYLPDFYKIYKICESMNITTDFLIKGKNHDLADIDIDYLIFDEVMELINDYANKHRIKKISSAEYFSMYHAILKLKEVSIKRTSIKEAFEILEPIIISHLRKDFIPK
jgi:transcriptional regulator with XRE-family HTH domain